MRRQVKDKTNYGGSSAVAVISDRLSDLRTVLGNALIEREAETDAILLGLIAGEHVLLVGPPGTAKSLVCRSVAQAIAGCRYVERLLAPTTPPEAIFGPISLSALREDRYEHVSAGSVTEAELVFLDEFFRGSDAIRDTLLHLLGPERQALVGTKQVKAPLRSAIAASNSWADSADQAAILDRWLIRRTVRPVSPAGRRRLLRDQLPAIEPVVSLSAIEYASEQAAKLPVQDATWEALDKIVEELAAAGIRPSDRRLRASVKIARAAAVLAEADEVQPVHLEPLGDVLWVDPAEQPLKCSEIVGRIANPIGQKLTELLREVDEVTEKAVDAASRLVAIKKLEQCEKQAEGYVAQGNGRAAKVLAHVKREAMRQSALALGLSAEKVAEMVGKQS